jgi:hypothetical protein
MASLFADENVHRGLADALMTKKAPLCLIFSQAQGTFQGSERAPHLVSPSSDPI